MALITLRDIVVSFGGQPLLDSLSLAIEPGERLCLLGRNGVGKSTLLRIVAGELSPDQGVVERERGVRTAMLSQAVPEALSGTCSEVVSSALESNLKTPADHSVEAVLSRLDLQPGELFESMSGGLKRRALLARALVNDPDVLLLDEPTNHLDVNTIVWLEEFLLRYRGTLMFVTHDRALINKLATRIVEIDRGQLTSWSGDYQLYLERKAEAQAAEKASWTKFDKKLAEEEVWIRQGVRERRTRNEGRVRALKKMREEARTRRKGPGELKMQAQMGGRSAKRVVEANEISFGYKQDKEIINSFSGTVYRGDKLGIVGPNGAGKTTLLRLLLGELTPTKGEITLGDNLQIAYLDQLRDQLDDQKSVLENVVESGEQVIIDGRPKHIFTYLKEFLFTSERAKTPVWVLSGGERNRLLLAKLFVRPANVMVLDEPTNDLDIETLELLEDLLWDYPGTVLLVSHDRAFLNNVASSTLVFEGDGRVQEYAGGLDQWLEAKRVDTKRAKEKKKEPKSKKRNKPQGVRKLTFNETRELDSLPGHIEEIETEQEQIHEKMADPAFYRESGDEVSAFQARLEQLETELLEAYERWEELEGIREGGS